MNLNDISTKKKIVLLVMPSEEYSDYLIDLLKSLSGKTDGIGYITLNKTHSSLVEEFKRENLDMGFFYFIDAISETVSTPKPQANVAFVHSPKSFTNICVELRKAIEKAPPKIWLFDSLSTIPMYEKDSNLVVQFIHDVINHIKSSGAGGILTVLERNMDTPLVKDIQMFADGMVKWDELNLGAQAKSKAKSKEVVPAPKDVAPKTKKK